MAAEDMAAVATEEADRARLILAEDRCLRPVDSRARQALACRIEALATSEPRDNEGSETQVAESSAEREPLAIDIRRPVETNSVASLDFRPTRGCMD